MTDTKAAIPAGVTVSKILPGYQGSQGETIPEPVEPTRKKFRKHHGTKINMGRADDALHPDADAEEATSASVAEFDEDADEEEKPATGAAGRALHPEFHARTNLPEYKAAVTLSLREFFIEEDFEECVSRLRELHTPFFGYEFVRKALTMAIERTDKERELVSRLLSYAYGIDITMEQIGKGFERLFENIDDIALDVPDCRAVVSKFLARAVADEILPPAYLNDSYVNSLAGDVVVEAKTLLSTKHSISRLEHVWHVNSAFSIPALKDTIVTTLKEYFSEGNVEEAIRCLKELEAPHFLHEAVYRALVLTIETWPDAKKADLTLSLFQQLQTADVIGKHQTAKGFSRCEQNLPDLSLDAPAAKEAFGALQERAASSGLLL